MIRKILFVFALLSTYQLINLSTCYASFEDIGAGARATGMGNTFVPLADDVWSIYYNPAGLGQLKQREFSSSYGRLYWGLDDQSNLGSGFLGFAYPFKEKIGTFGFGWMSFNLTDYYQENAFIFSYGRKIGRLPLFSGINLKFLSKKYGEDEYTRNDDPVFASGYSKSGMSADVGILWKLPYSFNFGLSVSDFLQPDMGLKSKSPVPLGVKAGIGYCIPSFDMGIEGSYRDKEWKIYSGGEKWLLNHTLAVRSGLGIGGRNFCNFTLGASYLVSLLRFDYSFVFPLSGISDMYGSHRVAMTLRFGPLPPGELEEPTQLKKKLNELEEKSRIMEKRIKELEEIKRKTEEEAARTKSELEKLKKEVKPPEAPGEKVPKPPGVRTHKVTEGESLQSIAIKYYGDERRWIDIYNANKDKIERGVVKPGQILVIP